MKKQLIKTNLHTHTSFCDGKHTPEEIVLSAIEKGMDTIGFSGHSYVRFDNDWTMTPKSAEEYFDEVLRLKQQYADRICILLGVEQDILSEKPSRELDFSIGSVHYVEADGEHFSVDHTFEIAENAVNAHFKGDWYRYARTYFETVATVKEKTECDVVGHFDLVSKFNERFPRFDESDPRYLHPAMEALDALLDRDAVLEVNTGAIARGYRRAAYPAPLFLHRIAERRGNVTLSSDAHDKENLLYAFPEACKILRASGLTRVLVRTKNGWDEIGI